MFRAKTWCPLGVARLIWPITWGLAKDEEKDQKAADWRGERRQETALIYHRLTLIVSGHDMARSPLLATEKEKGRPPAPSTTMCHCRPPDNITGVRR
ncbi:hypothetical protein ElyMa_002654800 [Elysia marginata]|uniref:Secreted protein n=1 Tax=Elysia marginata TaxID=1093978 RepID=A0AAV4H7J9_9GAST|nr:hypothetical protein ElyMa_002654800 [Elysia marginata]